MKCALPLKGEILNLLCRTRFVARRQPPFAIMGSECQSTPRPAPSALHFRPAAIPPPTPLKETPDDQLPVGDHLEKLGRKASAPSRLVLAVIVSTVMDAAIIVVYIALWAIDFNLLVKAFQERGWISLLLSVIPLILGAILFQRSKKAGPDLPETHWGKGEWRSER